jgi:AcrR family transcriptional regulator
MSKKRFIRNKEQKKQLIFQTFATLVKEEGYDKLSTRHIAETANISIGTIYYYFPGGKHAIASGFIEHITHQLFDLEMFKRIDLQNLQDFLATYIRKHLKIHRQNLEIHHAIDQAILADREVFHRHQEKTKFSIQKISKKLKELGIYKDLPEPFIFQNLFLFFNLLEAIIHRHLYINPFYDRDEELVEFLVIFFSCLVQNKILFSL